MCRRRRGDRTHRPCHVMNGNLKSATKNTVDRTRFAFLLAKSYCLKETSKLAFLQRRGAPHSSGLLDLGRCAAFAVARQCKGMLPRLPSPCASFARHVSRRFGRLALYRRSAHTPQRIFVEDSQ